LDDAEARKVRGFKANTSLSTACTLMHTAELDTVLGSTMHMVASVS
jgi:hypothetical protein